MVLHAATSLLASPAQTGFLPRAATPPGGTLLGMKRLGILALSLAAFSLTSCSSDASAPISQTASSVQVTSPAQEVTAPAVSTGKPATASDVIEKLNASGKFFCESSGILIASFGDGDSFYRNAVDSSGRGLEEITLNMVSYARFTAPIPADSTSARKALLEKAGSSWVSAGIPDTIALEELPAQASKCLDFFGVDTSSIEEVVRRADGSLSFASGILTGSVNDAGLSLLDENSEIRLFIGLDALPTSTLPEFSSDASSKRTVSPVMEVSPEEFQTFVGG